jgi:hypothetical protein
MTEAEQFHKAQLAKAAEMARKDLSALSPSERVKLQADLHEFLLSSDVHMLVDVRKLTTEEIMKTLAPIRSVPEMLEGIREILQWLVVQDGKSVMGDPERPGTIYLFAPPSTVKLELRADNLASPFRLNFAMEPNRETAQFALLYHLKHSGVSPSRIRLCPRRECKNIFILGVHADPKQPHYCSTKCSRAAALRVYRLKNKARALVSKGRSVASIARELGEPIETIEKMLGRSRGKTGVRKMKGRK